MQAMMIAVQRWLSIGWHLRHSKSHAQRHIKGKPRKQTQRWRFHNKVNNGMNFSKITLLEKKPIHHRKINNQWNTISLDKAKLQN